MDANLIEKYVISGLFNNESVRYELEGLLSPLIFKNPICQAIFYSLERGWDNNVTTDFSSLYSFAKEHHYELLSKEQELVSDILSLPTNIQNVIEYAKILYKRKAIHEAKSYVKLAHDTLNQMTGEESLDEILEITESPSYKLLDTINSYRDIHPINIGEKILDYAKERINNPREHIGIPTPFPKFNRAIGGGLRPGLTLVAAPSKSGKSSFAKEVLSFLSGKIPVLYIDTEMDEEEQMDRILSSGGQVNTGKVERGELTKEEALRVLKAAKDYSHNKFFHKKVPGFSFEEILQTIKRWLYKEVGFNEEGKLNQCIVVYDYFKIMNPEKELANHKEYEAIYYNASRLSDFCGIMKLPVLAFVQLNREGQIAQSQRLEWISKSISFLERKTPEEIAEFPGCGTGKLIPKVQRFGHDSLDPGDYINLHFDNSTNSIKEGLTFYEAKKKLAPGFDNDDDSDGLF